jgi:hypothetical protein
VHGAPLHSEPRLRHRNSRSWLIRFATFRKDATSAKGHTLVGSAFDSELGEALADYVQSIFGKPQDRQFFASVPTDFGCVIGGLEFASCGPTEEINQDVVILHALFSIAQYTVVNAEQVSRFDDQSGFFADLPDGRFADHFADLQHTSGDGPLGLERRVGAFHEEDTGVLDDDSANTHQRKFREFTLHGSERNDGL